MMPDTVPTAAPSAMMTSVLSPTNVATSSRIGISFSRMGSSA